VIRRYWIGLLCQLLAVRIAVCALYQSLGGGISWQRLPRVYNVWLVWRAKLLKE